MWGKKARHIQVSKPVVPVLSTQEEDPPPSLCPEWTMHACPVSGTLDPYKDLRVLTPTFSFMYSLKVFYPVSLASKDVYMGPALISLVVYIENNH